MIKNNMNLEHLKQNDDEKKDIQVIQQSSFPLDNHMTELPMFLNYRYNKNKQEYIDIDEHPSLKVIPNVNAVLDGTEIEKKIYENNIGTQKRKLFMYNVGQLPRQFEQDVLHALIILFVKQNAPFVNKSDDKIEYDINEKTVYFTFYQLCKILKVPINGQYIKKIKQSIIKLKTTQYFSFDDGVFYDKEKQSYIVSNAQGISWIESLNFVSVKSTKDDETRDMNSVVFGDFLIHNLKFGYFSYLSNTERYFSLSSGFARSFYAYINKNMKDHQGNKLKYIKRSYDILMFKLGLDYKYPSRLKARLNKVLDEFKEQNLIKDYFYGDEEIIGKMKEECLYISSIPKDKLIKELNISKESKQTSFFTTKDDKESEEQLLKEIKEKFLKIPNNLKNSLSEIGLDNSSVESILREYDKWAIIKYLTFTQINIKLGKINRNAAGYFRTALKFNFNLKGFEYIDEFINNKKSDLELKNKSIINSVEELYNDYIEKEIYKFKNEQSDFYNMTCDGILQFQNARIDQEIQNRMKLNQDYNDLLEFKEKQQESKFFKTLLTKEIKVILGLKDISQFKAEYYNSVQQENNKK